MERCKTCKHWKKPESDFGEMPGAGRCKVVPQFWDATEWSEDGGTRTLKPEYAGRLAFAQGGFHASLKTLADFGCVQHEPA